MAHGGTTSLPLRLSVSKHLCSMPFSSSSTHNQHPDTERHFGYCHICYTCHQLQETSHKWSGLWVSEDVRLVLQQHSGLPMPTPPHLPPPLHPSAHCLLPCSLGLYDIDRRSELHRMKSGNLHISGNVNRSKQNSTLLTYYSKCTQINI